MTFYRSFFDLSSMSVFIHAKATKEAVEKIKEFAGKSNAKKEILMKVIGLISIPFLPWIIYILSIPLIHPI